MARREREREPAERERGRAYREGEHIKKTHDIIIHIWYPKKNTCNLGQSAAPAERKRECVYMNNT